MEPLQEAAGLALSLYYFFVFGAFVALALWLPRYLVGAYGLDIKTAGMIARLLFDSGQPVPGSWRLAVGQDTARGGSCTGPSSFR
jgi:hypothetical protein